MQDYSITIAPDQNTNEYEVVLRGPGIDPDGRRYIFANTYRCASFAEAVNFAYRQGFRDGRQAAREESHNELLLVSGSTPENLVARPETWWQRTRRRWRHRHL
jgi:intein-encoded DNA endonuclease-like protein